MMGGEKLADLFGLTPIAGELMVMLMSILAGALVILIYSAYSGFIVKLFTGYQKKKQRFFLGIADAIFWIICMPLVFIIYYVADNARMRFYCYAFFALGMLCTYNIKLIFTKRKTQKNNYDAENAKTQKS